MFLPIFWKKAGGKKNFKKFIIHYNQSTICKRHTSNLGENSLTIIYN